MRLLNWFVARVGHHQVLQSVVAQSTDIQIRMSSFETRPAPPSLQCAPISDEQLDANLKTLQADVSMLKSNLKARGVVFAEPHFHERPAPSSSMAEAKGILDEWQSDLKEQQGSSLPVLPSSSQPPSTLIPREPQPVPRAATDMQQLVADAVAAAMARQSTTHTQHLQSQVDQLSRALYSLSAFAAPTSSGKYLDGSS